MKARVVHADLARLDQRRQAGVHAHYARLRDRVDDDLVDVGRQHAPDVLVSMARRCVGQAGDSFACPSPQALLVVIARGGLRGPQLALQMLFATSQLRKPLVQQWQVRRLDAHHDRVHGCVDLVQLALDGLGIRCVAVVATGQGDKPHDGFIDALAVGEDELLQFPEHP